MSENHAGKHRDASGRIVVGVDGSPSSEEALRWAVQYGRLTRHPVDAVISWNWPVTYGMAPGPYDEDFRGDAAEALDKSVQNVVAAEDAGLVSQLVLRGHPAQVLGRLHHPPLLSPGEVPRAGSPGGCGTSATASSARRASSSPEPSGPRATASGTVPARGPRGSPVSWWARPLADGKPHPLRGAAPRSSPGRRPDEAVGVDEFSG